MINLKIKQKMVDNDWFHYVDVNNETCIVFSREKHQFFICTKDEIIVDGAMLYALKNNFGSIFIDFEIKMKELLEEEYSA